MFINAVNVGGSQSLAHCDCARNHISDRQQPSALILNSLSVLIVYNSPANEYVVPTHCLVHKLNISRKNSDA